MLTLGRAGGGGGMMPSPLEFSEVFFFLENVFSSCSFIPRARFEQV